MSDVLGLLLAWGAAILGRRHQRTLHLRFAQLLNPGRDGKCRTPSSGVWSHCVAVHRFSQPPVVAGLTVTLVAGIRIVITVCPWLFVKEAGRLEFAAYLHMAVDALVSLGVVVASGNNIYRLVLA
jgi:cobalt-zinc-cadmium efflux system protein